MPPGIVGHPRVDDSTIPNEEGSRRRRQVDGTVQFSRVREFSRTHMMLASAVVRMQARIKSIYRSRGVLVTGIDVYTARRREEWLKQLPSNTQI